MKNTGLNFRHLYYFWVVAKEDSITRAAERLGVAIQTISTQLGLLEKSIGKSLFAPQGRRLVLTEAGRIAMRYAEQIFALGEQMEDALSDLSTLALQGEAVDRALVSARDTTLLAKERYQQGLTSYLDVVDAQRAALQAERQDAQLRGQRAVAAVLLAKALGGGWESDTAGLPQ